MNRRLTLRGLALSRSSKFTKAGNSDWTFAHLHQLSRGTDPKRCKTRLPPTEIGEVDDSECTSVESFARQDAVTSGSHVNKPTPQSTQTMRCGKFSLDFPKSYVWARSDQAMLGIDFQTGNGFHEQPRFFDPSGPTLGVSTVGGY
jgi:hypothetical protein